jgi:hypothetical protein
VLDSAVGLHQGGQISAPVFTRIAQQVLEYMHTPHDLEIPASRQTLLAAAKTPEKDLEEGSPDHPGEEIETAADTGSSISGGDSGVAARRDASASLAAGLPGEEKLDGREAHPPSQNSAGMIPAAMRERVPPQPQTQPGISNANSTVIAAATVPSPTSGTVVLDVEQGGITVPSFSGKSVRSAIELAESSGLDLDVVGSGVGQEQNPPAGAHVLSGARITVKFGR